MNMPHFLNEKTFPSDSQRETAAKALKRTTNSLMCVFRWGARQRAHGSISHGKAPLFLHKLYFIILCTYNSDLIYTKKSYQTKQFIKISKKKDMSVF
jgi:hypothetical protein